MNSCIDILVRRVSDILSFGSKRLGERLSFMAERTGREISFRTERIDDSFVFNASRVGQPISFHCSLVCSVGYDDDGYEVFLVKEGVFLLSDGLTYRVIKQNG